MISKAITKRKVSITQLLAKLAKGFSIGSDYRMYPASEDTANAAKIRQRAQLYRDGFYWHK